MRNRIYEILVLLKARAAKRRQVVRRKKNHIKANKRSIDVR